MAAVCRLTRISQPASGNGVHGFGCSQQAFSKTTKQQELGVAVHSPAKLGVEAFWTATFKKAKRKAPHFKRSTVLFWWRIAGSNR